MLPENFFFFFIKECYTNLNQAVNINCTHDRLGVQKCKQTLRQRHTLLQFEYFFFFSSFFYIYKRQYTHNRGEEQRRTVHRACYSSQPSDDLRNFYLVQQMDSICKCHQRICHVLSVQSCSTCNQDKATSSGFSLDKKQLSCMIPNK